MRDEHGSVTEIMVNDEGEIAVLGLPLDTEVYIEESTVPNGFFPNPAYKVVLTEDYTFEVPLETTITNTPSVKLGIDSDKYDIPIAIGITLLGVGVVAWRVIVAVKRKKKKKDNKEES
mgnify:FL=1